MKYPNNAIWLTILIFCLILVPLPGCGMEPDYSATIDQITALIKQKMEANQITGMSIALVDEQDVVWEDGFGYADKENAIKATTDTVYEIGSVTKTLTATAVMNAQDKELLNIDYPLKQYLPQFSILPPLGFSPDQEESITIRMMLTHHSGIPGNFLNGDLTINPRTDYDDWLLDYLIHDYAYSPPNFIYAYSNSAYCLLTDVVAAASGQSWEQYTDSMFETMGMKHTSYYSNKPFLKKNGAQGYFNGEPLEHFYNSHVGAGSVLSTAEDMAEYIKMINGKGQCQGDIVLKPETFNEIFIPQDLDIPLDTFKSARQGLGWVLTDPELEYAGRVCGHDGATVGFCAHLEILLDQQLGVVILTNSDQKNSLLAIVEIGRETLKLAVKDKAGIDPVEPCGLVSSPHAVWSQEKLEALAGIYVTDTGYDIIRAIPGGLEWTIDGGTPQQLVPLGNGRFALSDSQKFQVEFTAVSGRDIMIMHGTYTNIRGEKYEALPMSAVWHNRLGKYAITNIYPGDSYEYLPEELRLIPGSIDLVEKDGMLLIKYPVQGITMWIVIEPLSDTVGLIRGLGNDKGGALQIVMVDGQEQLQLWGCLFNRS